MSKQYKRILVPLDGSEMSEKGLDMAINFALALDAQLILAHVVDFKYLSYPTNYQVDLRQETINTGTAMLEKYKEHVIDKGHSNVETVIEEGIPKDTIAQKLVDRFQIDLIIMGASGLNAFEKFIIGSTTEYVNRNTSSDVLIVR